MEHILNLEQVKKYYGGNSGNITKAVDGISMYVDKGEFVAIMGASGSGKTTLLNCISTIDTVTSGHITVNNQDITKIKDKDFADFRRENLGFIFQDFNLLDTLTIEENISLSLVINKQNPADIDKRVHAIADKLGIRDILSKFPYEVSGGQKQRCACARALINEPKLILADEPTGALDSKSSRLLLETMSDINKKMQATILMVTHDPFSASFCERILFLKDGKIWIIGLIVLFSVLVKSYTGVLLGTGGSVLGVYLISFFPKAWKYTPTTLMESASLLIGTKSIEDYGIAVLITILLVVICLIVSITVMNRKQL